MSMDEKRGLNGLSDDHAFNVSRDKYVADAWAARRFLEITSR